MPSPIELAAKPHSWCALVFNLQAMTVEFVGVFASRDKLVAHLDKHHAEWPNRFLIDLRHPEHTFDAVVNHWLPQEFAGYGLDPDQALFLKRASAKALREGLREVVWEIEEKFGDTSQAHLSN